MATIKKLFYAKDFFVGRANPLVANADEGIVTGHGKFADLDQATVETDAETSGPEAAANDAPKLSRLSAFEILNVLWPQQDVLIVGVTAAAEDPAYAKHGGDVG